MAISKAAAHGQAALRSIEEYGLLLVSDSRTPSVAGIVTGERVSGSWWGHPLSHEIFRVNQLLASSPDITTAKLIYGKVTFIHRKLWEALVAVGTGRELWQTNDLLPAALSLMNLVARRGEVRIDEVSAEMGLNHKALSGASNDLEVRLLVHAEGVHTESGAHSKQLESWEHWGSRVKALTGKSASEGRSDLQEAAARLCFGSEEGQGRGRRSRPSLLPWTGVD
jgi:hypothetical protein